MTGLAVGAWNVTGGFGMVKAWGADGTLAKMAGKLGYQMIGTSAQSIGSNWASGKPLLSKVTLGVGPINLTLGKNQKLLQWQNNIGNIAMNAYGMAILASGGEVVFDKDNLSVYYKGGLVDKLFPIGDYGFSPHVVTGNSNVEKLFTHELHHLWQSRAFNDVFLLNYGLQGLNSIIIKGSFIENGNYYEDFINLTPWWE